MLCDRATARARATLPAAPAPQAHEVTLQFTKQYDAATRSTLPGSCLWRFGATGHTQLGFDCENAALLMQHHQLQPASAGYRTHERLAAGSWRLRGVGTAPAGGGRKAMTVVRVSAGEANRQTAFVVVRINGQMFAVSADLLIAPLEGGPTGPHKQPPPPQQQPLVTSAGDIGGSSVRGVTVGGSANTTTSGGDRNGTQYMHCVLLSAAEVAPLLRAAASAAGGSDGSGNAVQAPTAAHITRCDVYLGEGNLHGYIVHLRLVPAAALAPQRQSQLVPAAGEKQPARQPLQVQVQAPPARAPLPAAAAAQLNLGVPHRCAQVQAQAQAAAGGVNAQVGTGPIDQAGADAAVADPDAAEACAILQLARQPQPSAERRQLHKPTGLEPRPCGELAALVAAAVTVADASATAAGVSNTAPAAPGAAAATAQAEVARHTAPCESGSSSDGSSLLDLSNLLLQPAKLLAVAATAWPATTAAAAAPAMVASAAAGRVGPSPNHTVFVRLCNSAELLPLPQQLCPLGGEHGPVATTEVQHQSVHDGSEGALLGDGWAFEPQAPEQCCIRLLSPAGPLAPDADAATDVAGGGAAGAAGAASASCGDSELQGRNGDAAGATGTTAAAAINCDCRSRLQCAASQAVFVAVELEEEAGPTASGSSSSTSAQAGAQPPTQLQPLWARLRVDSARGHWALALPSDVASHRLLRPPPRPFGGPDSGDEEPHQQQEQTAVLQPGMHRASDGLGSWSGTCVEVRGCSAHVVPLLPPRLERRKDPKQEGGATACSGVPGASSDAIPGAVTGRPVLLLTLRLRWLLGGATAEASAAGQPVGIASCMTPAPPFSAPQLLLSAMAPTLPLQWVLAQAAVQQDAAAGVSKELSGPLSGGGCRLSSDGAHGAVAGTEQQHQLLRAASWPSPDAEVPPAPTAPGAAPSAAAQAASPAAGVGLDAAVELEREGMQEELQRCGGGCDDDGTNFALGHHGQSGVACAGAPAATAAVPPAPSAHHQLQKQDSLPAHLLPTKRRAPSAERESLMSADGRGQASGVGVAAAGVEPAAFGAMVGLGDGGCGPQHALQHGRCVRARSEDPQWQAIVPPPRQQQHHPQLPCPAGWTAQAVAAAAAAAHSQPSAVFVMEVFHQPPHPRRHLQQQQQQQQQEGQEQLHGFNHRGDEGCDTGGAGGGSGDGEMAWYRDQVAAAARIILSLGQRLAEADAERGELRARLEESERRLAMVRAAVVEGGKGWEWRHGSE